MMMKTHSILAGCTAAGLLLAGLGLVGCAQPVHQQYDFGRAYTTTLMTQADLSRRSAEGGDYPISGVEGLELRQRVIEESTDTETNQAEYTQSFVVE